MNLALVRLFARSKKGSRAYGERPQKRGQNVSIIGAMGFNGIVTQCSLMGGIDGMTFEAFVSQKLVPKLWKGACVVMDNCSIHKGSRIRYLIEEVGAKLIYLPTYSPDFNQARKLLVKAQKHFTSNRCKKLSGFGKSN